MINMPVSKAIPSIFEIVAESCVHGISEKLRETFASGEVMKPIGSYMVSPETYCKVQEKKEGYFSWIMLH